MKTTDIWLTPRFILDNLGEFDLDPCSAPDVKVWPTAYHHITLPDNGLAVKWKGRVWLNPPYSNPAPWMRKMAEHGNGVALISACTDTRWFFDFVWSKATGVFFIKGRLSFHLADGGKKASARSPSVLATYGNDHLLHFAEVTKTNGQYIKLR